MSVELKLDAQKRTDLGRGASRRLRRANKLPAVLYGGHEEALSLVLDSLQVQRLMEQESFYSQILTVNIDGNVESAVLKDLQRHPVKPKALHMDLQRIRADEKMRSHISFHFIGQDETIKRSGGVIHHDMIEAEIECLPKDLPQYIEVDCTNLQIGDSLHLSDLKLPQGVSIPVLAQGADHDSPVVSLHAVRGGATEEAASTGEEPA